MTASTAKPFTINDDIVCALDPVEFARRCGIEPYGKQIEILRSRSKRRILNWSRQAGKSTTTAIVIAHQVLYQPETLTILVSPSERQSKLLLNKVYKFLGQLDFAIDYDVENKLEMKLKNGSEVYALPGNNESTVRGFSSVDLLVIDEAAKASNELYDAVEPMLMASQGTQILLSTPWKNEGFFYDTWIDEDSDWEKTEIPATDVPMFDKTDLERLRKKKPKAIFEREYMCKFTGSIDQLFDEEIILAMFANTDLEALFEEEDDNAWELQMLRSETPR